MQTGAISQNTASLHSIDKIKQVAKDFEALFSSMMVKSMRKTVGDNPLVPASFGEKVYTEMLDDEFCKLFSTFGSLGLSELIEKELYRLENPDSTFSELKKLETKDTWTTQNRFPGLSQNVKHVYTSDLSRWQDLISENSLKFGIDQNLIKAVITQESAGNPYAVSRAGAKGLMQLMDSTAKDLGVSQPFSPSQNIEGGVRYLKSLMDKFNGNEKLALASYNAGPAAVEKYKGIPPFSETINYVDSVLRLKEHYLQKD